MQNNWWEDLKLMRRLFWYDSKIGLIYTNDRLPEDFYDTGEGSSFVSAAGAAAKYNKERSGKLTMNRRVKTERSTCYYLCGGISYRGHDKKCRRIACLSFCITVIIPSGLILLITSTGTAAITGS